ncbi:ATP-dependent sacrificial sulfur transferase LarE [Salicibibacter cibi]|uniref:ATP-dependent sacrificial sulfur transferase LarE n=1 Tax=Salicibibacter cibi TaxID=2743001 RepID=A0A7T7CED5_9BACI|nr:ATP-dependent sacrificial sulfur transferase LarE [Salicibibacter cibi]QQK78905.1 ATP-dependent sacrificial sulfur transferase LarE [Salicibibacter cibi]
MKQAEKLHALQELLAELKTVVVAYSGGVDSTFLLAVALQTLGKDHVLAVTANSETLPERELAEAKEFAASLGAHHQVIETSELAVEGFEDNLQNRCYLCRDNLFENLRPILEAEGFENIVFGLIADDMGEHRPGVVAAREHGVRGPLQEVELYKDEIRALSQEMGLSTWNKPSYACLASRIAYEEKITIGKLEKVDQAEQCVQSFGVRQVRVRAHEQIARIEVEPGDMEKVLNHHDEITGQLRELGFVYVTLDLAGYKSGSMNAALATEKAN